MSYTPYAGLTDTELIREVANKKEPTDLEIELMERLVQFRKDVLSICSNVGEEGGFDEAEVIAGVVERAA